MLTGCALVSVARADFERDARLAAETVVIRNLIGQIEIEGHDGPDFEIRVRVQGADATADRVPLVIDEGRRAEVTIRFPLDESKRYVYPRMKGGNMSFSVSDADAGWLTRLLDLGGGNVKVSGRGLEIWADVVVLAPRGGEVVIEHGAGTIEARDVEADLDLSIRSGPVDVLGAGGSVSVDTGSGNVKVANIDGELHVDTGSGNVSASHVTGNNVHVDTGSGRVDLDGVVSSSLHVDTGSGGVDARAVSADDLTIDTGSGSVALQLDRMGGGSFDIDTGSGSIDLRLPPDASVDVEADTGGGGITLDLTGDYRVRHEEKNEAELTIGGGDAELELDTGSGSIHISQ
jgi:hypothetical protein